MIISLFDYLWTNLDSAVKDENSDEILEEKSKETNNKSHDIDSTGFCLFFFAHKETVYEYNESYSAY